nr:HNH endonuclease [Delftia acidovorans]
MHPIVKGHQHGPILSRACIPFNGGRRKNGYGYLQFMGKQVLAHRLAYALNEMLHPDALVGVVIRHRCDNPCCINVEHLEPGTAQDNTNDKVQRGRHLKGEQVGNSKLSAQEIRDIRANYRPYSKDANQYRLAQQYGVSQAEISHIVSKKRWQHL